MKLCEFIMCPNLLYVSAIFCGHLQGGIIRKIYNKDFLRRELKITGILDKIDEYRLNWHLHLQRMPQN